ncbi:uncharacterized protein EV154DRAFT_558949 [Mucor mucedo]|uniref:uncharacterized protein n=1 Tax=Mucor mucedo TaxID=29922 RepID=UPI00221F869C|nr:uncharacterized protein EV154DRAFT_558949 [Mucor mucedo]KAI7895889.1 hypothetical protein EV154DRAFT_558949 [Mucor mucedo]
MFSNVSKLCFDLLSPRYNARFKIVGGESKYPFLISPASFDKIQKSMNDSRCNISTDFSGSFKGMHSDNVRSMYRSVDWIALQEQMLKIIKYYRGNNLVGRTDVLMIPFGSRNINLNTERKTAAYTETMKTYLAGLSQSWDNRVLADKSERAYPNTRTLCKHFLVAYFGDTFSTGFTWTSLDENVNGEVTELLECISFFWNNRVVKINIHTLTSRYKDLTP